MIVEKLKSDNYFEYKKKFPIFKNKVNGKDLVYLDSAASAQKPEEVIKSIKKRL